MARARNIKPGFFKNEVLGVADPLYSLLFEGLWLLADRAGRLEDRPLRIKGEVFPYREGIDIDAMLNWLQENEFIQRYEVDSKKYILVLEFVKHQNPHKNEADSIIPPPDEIGKKPESIGTTRADPGFRIPDSVSLIPEKSAAALPPDGVSDSVWADFLKIRKAKRAPMTDTALDGIRSEAQKAGLTLQEALQMCCARGWQGFKAAWLDDQKRGGIGQTIAGQRLQQAQDFAPGIAASPLNFIDEVRNVPSIASR